MASTYLTKTLGTATNLKKFTISCWVKRCGLSALQEIISSNSAANYGRIHFEANDRLRFSFGSTSNGLIETNRLFRDISSWYHIVCVADTTLATADDRLKIYVNGTQETSFASRTNPTLNEDSTRLNSATIHSVGSLIVSGSHSQYLNGALAHFHFIDGTAYDADTFGETDSTTGEWKPKSSPSVTYGTNGFFLKFENSSDFGEDSSGNDNDFTTNGTGTQLVDTPTNVLATMNPLVRQGLTLSNANSTGTTTTTSQWVNMSSTLAVSKGKWYFEVKKSDTIAFSPIIGITDAGQYGSTNYQKYAGIDTNGFGFYYHGTDAVWRSVTNSTNSNFGSATPSASNGDIYMFAADLDNNYIYFGIDGTWHNSGDPTSGSSGTGGIDISSISGKEVYFCATNSYNTSGTSTTDVNFGNGYFGTTAVTSGNQDDAGYGTFEYDVPTGYYTLNTKNINTYG